MTLFKSAFSRLSYKPTPVATSNTSLGLWCHQLPTHEPSRFVHKVELCSARATGQDAWGSPVAKHHRHTFLRVSLAPAPGASTDTLLIERVLSTGGAYHSVTPIRDTFAPSGSLFHPDVHDRLCILSDSTSRTARVQDLQVERTRAFGDGRAGPRLTLGQLGLILGFVSRTTGMVCAGGECQFQARSFAFTCLAALTPTLPPPRPVRRADDDDEEEEESVAMMGDSVFELGAEAFLGQIPWLVNDPVSLEALGLIGVLKDGPRQRATARLYH